MTIYSQRDPRWSNQKFGRSATIGGLGCTLTCLAMKLDITPDIVARKLDEVKAFGGSTGNFILWDRIHLAFPQLQFIKRVYSYNNADVKANLPCLVEVDFDGTDRTDDRHWVTFIGNQQMNDPWTGTTRSTSTYPLRGYAVVKRKP